MDNQQEVTQLLQDVTDMRKKLAAIEQQLLTLQQGGKKKILRDYIVEILENSTEPLTVKEIGELVLQAGYPTKALSENIPMIVLNCLRTYPEFVIATRRNRRPTRYAVERPK